MATEQIDSFDDLLGLLEREPGYRARLRQLILDEEFQQLPAAVRAQSERFDALTEQVRQLTAKMRDIVIRLDHHDVQLARLIGDEAERRVQRNAHAYFGNMLRRIRVISPSELADMIDDAIDAGSLDERHRAPLLALDVAVRGLDRRTRERAYLAVEVSAGIGEHDIIRAVDRARLLERLTGHPTRPVVAGYSVAPAYHYLAAEQGVAVTMVPPPDPGQPELPTDIKADPPP
ncbi:MAG: hypothetical protein OXL37_10175 [Chloroflexota bacterium]|nr:hypothetical protein [Chloroflexota bacterium]MDE2960756.1 hypothetical protein [Chloroflexota bacterium]